MSDNKSRDIFYGVVAIATLIVALVGATLAYFSISANSNPGAVNAKADRVSITYEDGKQVTAQADKLIPSSFEVVQKAYANAKLNFGGDIALASNICIDDNERQVCSIYRFSVSSDSVRQMTATLNNEFNSFVKDLSYAIYDISGSYSCTSEEIARYTGTDEEKTEKCIANKRWQVLDDGNSAKYLSLKSCNNDDEDVNNHCYILNSGVKDYGSNSNSIFGYNSDSTIKTKSITANSTQEYDLVIFLNETNRDQNENQGASYQGTIVVKIVDSSTESGQITGTIND